MKASALSVLSDDEIVDLFIQYSIEQENMSLEMRSRSVARLYHKIDALVTELRFREGDRRHVLLPLLKHANPQVRLKAAQSLLAVARDEALAALKELSDPQLYMQALDAGMTLINLDRGILIPE
ncbi:DUF2019 domain-containing protein [Segnochrobactrum spirostomi]|uniref:DUF2019 domain-containing protein n=1 Tax=Segnochrobactrum spirostomi TaxID=2608987 RepID=A0A6A7Y7U9_9HYPH|nr:DUF2019 domain-containing protein [Segnochrobactrum spirostomi]MQT13732.1 DUF2019 domain-containing protein [Segnochrobactrum spirostomi]